MSDLISRQSTIDELNERQRELIYCFGFENDVVKIMDIAKSIVIAIPPEQPETSKIIVGKSRGGMTMWYQCLMCNEPVDENDLFCRRCGRRFVHE